ncbi:MAG TPA: hypothetical protein VIM11_10685 [Tepidisphaeraceae bacterium]|jgi:hypothetical protein
MPTDLEKRVAALEQMVAQMQRAQVFGSETNSRAWVDDLYGKFAGDSYFQEAMKLGREYRESLRPGKRKARPKR